MSRTHLGVLVAGLALATAALSACGSSNDNSADNDQITATITKSATSGDPAVCTELQTPAFNAQTSGGNGNGDPTKACEKQAADTAAKTVDVTNIKIDGDKATADVAATGSILDGQTIEVGLVKEGSQWKLDKVDSFTAFNRDAFIKGFEALVTKDPKTPASVATCIQQKAQSATDEQLQAVILTPNGGDTLFKSCAG
jgi:hypothetical protein